MHGKRVGIIGSGFSSLYAACKLAKAGFHVEVFEKNKQLGGRAQTFEAEGFRFDMGPSWYWMPDLIDRMFDEINEKRSDYFSLTRLETSYQVFWKDRDSTRVPADKNELLRTFDQLESNGGAKLERFLADAGLKYRLAQPMMEIKGEKLSELLSWNIIKNGLKLDVFKSVEKDVSKRFSSDEARGILNFPVLFLGAMPNEIPSLYTLMNYADLELGTWYPEGGMSALAKALVKIGEFNGVVFHTDNTVNRINCENGIAKSLVVNDSEIPFDFIVAGADYHHVEQNLIPKEYRRYTDTYWKSRKMAPSSLLYYIGVDQKLEGLEHHNLFFDENLNEHGKTIYSDQQWPEKPLFYACATSKTDSEVAPEGKENLFLLIPIAPDLEENDDTREKYLSMMLDRMEKHLGYAFRDKICYQRSFAVSDFKQEYNSFKGNAYGLANTLKQTAHFKPKMQSKLKNLFFCGQLTVPGPGVPPALISGKIAANQILKAL